MTRLPRLLIGLWIGLFAMPAMAQDADAPIQRLLQDHGEIISESDESGDQVVRFDVALERDRSFRLWNQIR